jgi:hypothetical protein
MASPGLDTGKQRDRLLGVNGGGRTPGPERQPSSSKPTICPFKQIISSVPIPDPCCRRGCLG